MKDNCPESCGFCEKETENSEEEGKTGDCEDNSEHAANCPGWKNMGYCEAGWRLQTFELIFGGRRNSILATADEKKS